MLFQYKNFKTVRKRLVMLVIFLFLLTQVSCKPQTTIAKPTEEPTGKRGPLIGILPFRVTAENSEELEGIEFDEGMAHLVGEELEKTSNFRVKYLNWPKTVTGEDLERIGFITMLSQGRDAQVNAVIVASVTKFDFEVKGVELRWIEVTMGKAEVRLEGAVVDVVKENVLAELIGEGKEEKVGGITIGMDELPDLDFRSKDFRKSVPGKASQKAAFQFAEKINEIRNKISKELVVLEPREKVPIGAGFSQDNYTFNIQRDHNQWTSVEVVNRDDKPHRFILKPTEDYEDLVVGFVGLGSIDGIYELPPKEWKKVRFNIMAPDAQQSIYKFPIYLYNMDGVESIEEAGETPYDSAEVTLNIAFPEFNLLVEKVSENPNTLAQLYRVKNLGEKISDLTVKAKDELQYKVTIAPSIDRYTLDPGEELEFEVLPYLYVGFSELGGEIVIGGASKEKVVPIRFALAAGKKIYLASVACNHKAGTTTYKCVNCGEIVWATYSESSGSPDNSSNSKSGASKAGLVADGVGLVHGIIGLIVAFSEFEGAVVLGAALGWVGVGMAALGIILGIIGGDPPDSNYSEIAYPDTLHLPPILTDEDIPENLTEALNELLDNTVESISYARVLLISLERYQGAVSDDEQLAAEMQLNAAKEYAQKLGEKLLMVSMWLKKEAIEYEKFDTNLPKYLSADDVRAFQKQVDQWVLSEEFQSIWKQLNFSTQQIDDYKQSLLSVDPADVEGHFPTKLIELSNKLYNYAEQLFSFANRDFQELAAVGLQKMVLSTGFNSNIVGAIRGDRWQNIPPLSKVDLVENSSFYPCGSFSKKKAHFVWHATYDEIIRSIYFSSLSRTGEVLHHPKIISIQGNMSSWPYIVEGPAEKVYVTWEEARAQSKPEIVFRASNDGGDTWLEPIKLTSHGQGAYKPVIVVSPDNKVYVAWEDYRNGTSQIFLAITSTGGNSFSKGNRLDSSEGEAFWPKVATDSKGIIHVVYKEVRSEGERILYQRSRDDGVTFSEPTELSLEGQKAGEPALFVEEDGTVHVVYRAGTGSGSEIVYVTKEAGNIIWAPEEQVTKDEFYSEYPSISAFDGTVYITFYSDRPKGGWRNQFYFVSKAKDDSQWGEILRLPSLESNVNRAFLEIKFTLDWDRHDLREYHVDLSVNDIPIGMLRNTIPEGTYIFPIDPSALNYSSSGSARDEILLKFYNINEGDFSIVSDVNLITNMDYIEQYVIASSQSEADKILERENSNINHDIPDIGIYANYLPKIPRIAKDGQNFNLKFRVMNIGQGKSSPVRITVHNVSRRELELPGEAGEILGKVAKLIQKAKPNLDLKRCKKIVEDIVLDPLDPFAETIVTIPFTYKRGEITQLIITASTESEDFDLNNNTHIVTFINPDKKSPLAGMDWPDIFDVPILSRIIDLSKIPNLPDIPRTPEDIIDIFKELREKVKR